MILEHFIPGKSRVNNPKVGLSPSVCPWSAGKDALTLNMVGDDGRYYHFRLDLNEAISLSASLQRAIESSKGMKQAEEARTTIAQVERALG